MRKTDIKPGKYIQLTGIENTFFVISREDFLWDRFNCYLIDNDMNICNYNPSTGMLGYKKLSSQLVITDVTDPVSEIGQETIDLMLEKAREFTASIRDRINRFAIRTYEEPEAPYTDETENALFEAFCNLTRY